MAQRTQYRLEADSWALARQAERDRLSASAVFRLQYAWRRHLEQTRQKLKAARYDGMVSLLRSAGMVKPGPPAASGRITPHRSVTATPLRTAPTTTPQRAAAPAVTPERAAPRVGGGEGSPAMAGGGRAVDGEETTVDELARLLGQLRDGLRGLDDQEHVRAGTVRTLVGLLIGNFQRLKLEQETQGRNADELAWVLSKARTALRVNDDAAVASAAVALRQESEALSIELASKVRVTPPCAVCAPYLARDQRTWRSAHADCQCGKPDCHAVTPSHRVRAAGEGRGSA